MNTQVDQQLSVQHGVDVPLSAERAFELFTSRMSDFWPASHSIGTSPIAEVRMEPQVGGRWFERGVDGSECSWGRVAAWGPPVRLVLVWQIGCDWAYDPTLETEVEVTFTELGEGGTRVDLTHRGLEQYGDQAEAMRIVFGSEGGWRSILDQFVAAGSEGR
jgi:uncharacterized protein YndB with AHSA1/START domain